MTRLGRSFAVLTALGLVLACGSATPKAATGSAGTTGSGGTSASVAGSSSTGDAGSMSMSTGGSSSLPSGPTSAAAAAVKLGRPAHFMVGLGNDLNQNND